MKRLLLATLIILLLIPALAVNADGSPRTIRLYLYQDYDSCVFSISWENQDQEASVQIQGPDGTIIEAGRQNAVFSRGRVTVDVGSARSGTWIIYVDGVDLGMINVSGGSKHSPYAAASPIRSFTADAADGVINFTWDAATEYDTVNIVIYAQQGSNYSRTIWSDSRAARSGQVSISADNLQTGLYTFMILFHDGRNQYTLATDKPVYVRRLNVSDKLENVRTGSVDGEMFVSWDGGTYGTYLVTLYDYETLSVIRSEQVNDTYYPITLPGDADKVKVSVAAVGDRGFGEFDVYEIIRTVPAGVVSFPEYDTTRSSVYRISISCPDGETAGVYIDGKLMIEDAATGDYDLNLAEGSHEIVAYVRDNYGNTRSFHKSVTVDRTPPVLNLNTGDQIETVTDSFVISGSTEPNAVVAVNGVEQELGDGSFMVKLALKDGINPITVSAYDAVGNKTVRTITVERKQPPGSGRMAYILPTAVFVLLAAWYIYLNVKARRAVPDEKAV